MSVRSGLQFLIESILILVLLMASDYALRYLVGITGWYINYPEWSPYIAISMALALISRRMVLGWTIAALAVLQLIWFGTYRYFGNPLSPDLILMSVSQFYEIGRATRGEFQLFVMPLVATVLLNAILFFVLIRLKRAPHRDLTRMGLVLSVLPFLVVGGRASLYPSPHALTPTKYMPSQTSTILAVTLAVRHLYSNQTLPDFAAPEAIYNFAPLPDSEPVTVVFIMGESIAPAQLELYGGAAGTMPRMRSRILGHNDHLSYAMKLGISAGVGTLGSVPMTLRLAHNPVVARRNTTTLSQLAKTQGFSVGLYSAQNILPLQMAGQLHVSDAIETVEDWETQFAKKQDAILIDQMTASLISGDKRFYFFHQRTNHTPYNCNIDHPVAAERSLKSSAAAPNENTMLSGLDHERVMRYRRGLLCYDQSLDQIIRQFETTQGALYIFITADHNEFFGEGGRWGHGQLDLDTALVPMILATNRPDSDVSRAFRALTVPTSFELMRVVAKSLGVDVQLSAPDTHIYVNGVLAFGQSGYLAIRRTDDVSTYYVSKVDASASDKRPAEKAVTIPLIKDIVDHLDQLEPR